jgi:hypothetical protein
MEQYRRAQSNSEVEDASERVTSQLGRFPVDHSCDKLKVRITDLHFTGFYSWQNLEFSQDDLILLCLCIYLLLNERPDVSNISAVLSGCNVTRILVDCLSDTFGDAGSVFNHPRFQAFLRGNCNSDRSNLLRFDFITPAGYPVQVMFMANWFYIGPIIDFSPLRIVRDLLITSGHYSPPVFNWQENDNFIDWRCVDGKASVLLPSRDDIVRSVLLDGTALFDLVLQGLRDGRIGLSLPCNAYGERYKFHPDFVEITFDCFGDELTELYFPITDCLDRYFFSFSGTAYDGSKEWHQYYRCFQNRKADRFKCYLKSPQVIRFENQVRNWNAVASFFNLTVGQESMRTPDQVVDALNELAKCYLTGERRKRDGSGFEPVCDYPGWISMLQGAVHQHSARVEAFKTRAVVFVRQSGRRRSVCLCRDLIVYGKVSTAEYHSDIRKRAVDAGLLQPRGKKGWQKLRSDLPYMHNDPDLMSEMLGWAEGVLSC